MSWAAWKGSHAGLSSGGSTPAFAELEGAAFPVLVEVDTGFSGKGADGSPVCSGFAEEDSPGPTGGAGPGC